MHRQFSFLLICLLFAGLSHAQQFRGSIAGIITDQQSAIVPNARVTGTQEETGTTYHTVSTTDGRYTLTPLLPGNYDITVEAAGFKKAVRKGIHLDADQHLQADMTIELGQVTETVSVTSDLPLLNTENASQGQVINTRDVENLPLNGRTPLTLAGLAAGVNVTTSTSNIRPFDNGGESSFSMGGGATAQNELLVDGNEDTRVSNGQVAYAPPVDAVAEVVVQTFNVDAAYGHTGGGTVNVIMKGGTNQLHGSLYEFNLVSALAANDWLLDKGGQPKPGYRRNQYGVTAGGPVFIPKVFNGKDRLFWYFAYEGIKDNEPESYNLTVPTAAERSGNFSALLALGPQYQIYNPYTGVVSGNVVARQPFPNNVIPPSLLNPVAQKILSYVPLPNQAGNAQGENNYIGGAQTNGYDNELGRIDYNVSERQKIYFNFRHNLRNEYDLSFFPGPGAGRYDARLNYGATFDDVYTFTPTLVLDTRLNWTRFDDLTTYGQPNFDFSQLGLPASLVAASTHLSFPAINLGSVFVSPGSNSGSGSTGAATSAGANSPEDSYMIFSTLTKVAGPHTVKVGADIRQYRTGSIGYGYSSGLYTFGTSFTNGPTSTSPSAPLGQELASFLLGLPTSGQFDQNAQGSYRQSYMAFFVQDDWRIRRNLTLNLGLRYDQDFPITEKYNRNVNGFAFGAVNPIQAAAQAAYAKSPIPQVPVSQFATPGGLTFASSQQPNIESPQSHIFSPRFGLSYSPFGAGSNTVIRAGVGVFVFPLTILAGGSSPLNQSGFSASTPLVATNNGYLTPSATLSNPFPNGLQTASGAALGLATFLGQNLTFYNPHPLNPYSLRWDFDVQHQFGTNVVVEVGYEGNHGIHLQENLNLNYIPPQYLSTSPIRNAQLVNTLSGNVPNPFAGLLPGSGLNGSTVALSQLLLPYPEFGSVTEQGVNDSSSFYEMAFVRIEKRFSHGVQAMVNYQHSRLEQLFRLNGLQSGQVREVTADDRPNRFVASVNYDLPFGRGARFGSSTGPVVSRLIGGWVVNAIYTYQTGPPLSFGNIIYLGGPLNLNTHNTQNTFNTSVFDRATADQPADNIRTFPQYFSNLRADNLNNADFSVIKNIRIREHVPLQLRFEFFNLFNHPTYAGPNLSPTSSAFGTITADAANNPRQIQLGARITW